MYSLIAVSVRKPIPVPPDHHATLDEIFCRDRADQALGERLRLRHEAPMPRSDHPALRDVCPHVIVGHNVHDAGFIDALGMIETQSVRRAAAAIVTGDHEAPISELLHDFDEIARHRAKAEIDIVGARIWQGAVAIAAQVGKNDVVLPGELRGDLVPAGMVLRIAMDQQ